MATTTKKKDANESAKNQANGNAPVRRFKMKGVTASVFANPTTANGRDTVFYKTQLSRIYRDGEEFKTTTSLSRDDLPIARELLQQAFVWICEAETTQPKERPEEAQ